MERLELDAMVAIQGGQSTDTILGGMCGYAAVLGFLAAGAVTGGLAWVVMGVTAGPACIAAAVGAAVN